MTAKGRSVSSAGDHVIGPDFGQSIGQSQGPVLVMHEKCSVASWKLQISSEAALGR